MLATHHGPAGSDYPFRSGGAAASRQHTRFATAPGAGRELHNYSSNQPDASGKQPAGGGVDQQWWQPLSTAAAGAAGDALHTSHGPWWRDPLPFRPNAASLRQQAQPLAEEQVLQGSPVHFLATTAAEAAAAGTVGAPAGGHGISSAHCAGILPPLGLQQASEGDLSPRALPPPPHPQHSDRHEGATGDQPSALQLLSRAYQQRRVPHPSRVVTTELPLPAAPSRPVPAADQHSSMAHSSGSHGISSSSGYTAGASDLSTSTWVAPSAAAKTAGVRLAARADRDTSALGVRLPSSLYGPPSPAAPATSETEHGHTSPSHTSSTSSLSAPSQQLSHGELQAMVDAVLGPLRQEVEASRRHVAAKLQEEAPNSSYARWALDHQRQQMLAPTAVDGHISSSQGGYSYSQQVAAGVWEEPGGLRQKYGRPRSQQSISSRASSRGGSGSDSDFQQLEQSQLQCQQDLSHAIDLALEQLGSMSVSAASAAAPGSSPNASAAQQQAAEKEAGLEQELQELSQMIEVLRAKFDMQDSQQLPRQRRSSSRGGGLAPPQRSYDVAPYPSYTSCATAAAGGRGASGGAAATTSLTSGSVCQRPGSASSAATNSSEDEVADTAQSRRVAAALAACLTRETPPGRSAGPAPSHATHLRWRHQAQQREAQEAAAQGLGRVYGRDGRLEMLTAQAGGQPLQQPAARRRLVWGAELPQRPL